MLRGAMEMVPCKHQDLSCIPSTYIEKPGMIVHTC